MPILKKIYFPPEVLGKLYRGNILKVAFYPIYNENHLIINKNPFGLSPIPIQPIIKRMPSSFNIEMYRMSDYKRRKWQKLSGNIAHIYALIKRDSGNPFYVGSTKNDINKRLKAHRKKKGKCDIFLLCSCPIEIQFDEERRWVSGAKKLGIKLTNIQLMQ